MVNTVINEVIIVSILMFWVFPIVYNKLIDISNKRQAIKDCKEYRQACEEYTIKQNSWTGKDETLFRNYVKNYNMEKDNG
jgi:Tfp pilus assembly protein PilE